MLMPRLCDMLSPKVPTPSRRVGVGVTSEVDRRNEWWGWSCKTSFVQQSCSVEFQRVDVCAARKPGARVCLSVGEIADFFGIRHVQVLSESPFQCIWVDNKWQLVAKENASWIPLHPTGGPLSVTTGRQLYKLSRFFILHFTMLRNQMIVMHSCMYALNDQLLRTFLFIPRLLQALLLLPEFPRLESPWFPPLEFPLRCFCIFFHPEVELFSGQLCCEAEACNPSKSQGSVPAQSRCCFWQASMGRDLKAQNEWCCCHQHKIQPIERKRFCVTALLQYNGPLNFFCWFVCLVMSWDNTTWE